MRRKAGPPPVPTPSVRRALDSLDSLDDIAMDGHLDQPPVDSYPQLS